MDVEDSDGGGIIGTPLDTQSLHIRNTRSMFKISAADMISPSRAVYDRIRKREAAKKERDLMDQVAVEAAGPANLYQRGGEEQHNQIHSMMDAEDRAHMQVSLRTKGSRASRSNTCEDFSSVPFAVAATDIPEIVPKPRTTSVGYNILRQTGLWPRAGRSTSRFADSKLPIEDPYRLAEFLAFVYLNKTDTEGLGYQNSAKLETLGNRSGDKIVRKGAQLFVVPTDDFRPEEVYEEDDNLDNLADSGYKNLDAAADRLQDSLLKRRRQASEKQRNERKRSLLIAGLDDSERVLFSEFERKGTLDERQDSSTQGQCSIPPEFSANPVHDFEKDPFRVTGPLLPDSLQREYDMLAKVQHDALEFESRAVNASIAKAKEMREEKLRKIRGRFLADMHSNFVSSSNQTVVVSDQRNASMAGDRVNRIATSDEPIALIGKSNRSLFEWKPCSLLCKRFEVTVRKDMALSQTAEEHPNGASPLYSVSASDEDDFQVHSIVGADGKRIDFRSASNTLVEDDSVVLTTVEPHRIRVGKRAAANPSRELYKVIFTENVQKGGGEIRNEPVGMGRDTQKQPRDASDRGIHKTRASDFF